ncbi:unnamed protein product, partial [Symbiodinium pilosum]
DYLPVQHLFTVWRSGRHTTTAIRGSRAVNSLNKYDVPLHIFVLFDYHEKKTWKYETDRLKHAGWFVTEDELLPLKSLSFGEFTVPVPADSEAYLNRMYGRDWSTTLRSMSALQELKHFSAVGFSNASMAEPTGPLDPVILA